MRISDRILAPRFSAGGTPLPTAYDVIMDELGDDLRWEPSRGGADFPHLYRPIRLKDIAWVRPLRAGPDGRFRFSEETGP